MKQVLVFVLLIASAFAGLSQKEYQVSFTNWMHKHGKSYSHAEFSKRFQAYKLNLDFVNGHKSESFKVGMNKFGDLSSKEFASIYNGLRVPEGYLHKSTPMTATDAKVAVPASWDWRTSGAVTAVKDQGQCGSCWSFSTTGSVEGCHFLGSAKALVGLSEQNLVDCSVAQGNQGCNGGLMTQAMQYIISNNGIDTEASYPYTATGPNNCQYSASSIGSTETSFVNVNSGDEGDLQAKVYTGPTSVAIDASQSSFQFYTSGVYNEPNCSSSQLDHGVLAVGWGTSSGTAYWIVKNSWSTSWGQNGYIWMSRNANNQCGIATMATLPTGC